MKEFSFYETVGVIAPGMVTIVGMVIMFAPDKGKAIMTVLDVSVGSLGMILVLAYVVGQLLQAVGNAIENIWWKCWGGMPTDWLRSRKRELIAPSQRTLLESRIQVIVNDPTFAIANMTDKHWYAITRQVYATVATANLNTRIDIFDSNYGLCRGISAGLFILLLTSVIVNWRDWRSAMLIAILVGVSIYRMHRFAERYGREMFVQFVNLKNTLLADSTTSTREAS